jgi:hypothetical protein
MTFGELVSEFEKYDRIPYYDPDKYGTKYIVPLGGCGMTVEEYEEPTRRDCFFYYEDHDMGATIPNCKFGKSYGDCPCEGCNKYVPRQEAVEIVMKIKGIKEE